MAKLFKDKKEIKVNGRPAWCSPGLWKTLAAGEGKGLCRVAFSFSKSERRVMRKRKPIKVSEWAEKHRVVVLSRLPGIWRNEVTPHMVGVMDGAARPFVHVISICKTPQSAGTEAVHNFVGYCIDRDPGPVMYIFADENTAKENSQDRIQPMIKSSPRLNSYMTGVEKDASSMRISLQHMPIYLAWARSASRLANKPIRYGIADEIDKEGYEPGKKETHPLNLIDKRFTTFRANYKFFKISTPTMETGNIWVALNEADVIFDYHVKCPFCEQLQLMDFKGIKWEGGSKADRKAILNKQLAWYECEHCKGKWDDEVRNRAARGGVWMARGTSISMDTYLDRFRPSNIGFHVPAWISYFVSLSECVHAFLKGLDSPLEMQDFLNGYCALPWKETVIKKDEDDIMSHKNELPAGVVPKGTIALTCGVDMQQVGFWFIVKAWKKDLSSHRVQYGYLPTWEAVENEIFNTRYPVEGDGPGVTMGIWRAALDTGGGKSKDDDWSRTEEAYEWLRKNSRGVVFGVKGASRPQVAKVIPRVIDKMARGNRPIPGGLVLYFLDTDKLKDTFFWRMERTTKQSQHITLNADTGMDYVLQILAEQKQKDKKGKVTWVQTRRDNHLLDCEIYSDACADPEWAPSLSFLAEKMAESDPGENTAPPQDPGTASQPDNRPSWYYRR
ncbi:MAG: phage terminase large subunit family protein [Desulfobacterales bacterium]|nr:phage terminase large subunit family protein [Desulfobacterales bacterium]